jgi:DNA uptake protein ComE-like DNA-binding protein
MSKRLHREFYLLSRGEQRGLIILSLLLILSLLFRITTRLLPEREPEGLEDFEQEASLLMAALARADSLQKAGQDSSGDRFTDQAAWAQTSFQRSSGTNKVQSIDINRADSSDLLPLPGIGPVFAGRIIKYRDLLGGFVSVDQMREVYGIPIETVRKIMNKVLIDSSAVRKIQIDSATFRELLRHPYLEYEDVKTLVEYRDFKGDISSVNELKINHILPDSILRKLDGYFDYR